MAKLTERQKNIRNAVNGLKKAGINYVDSYIGTLTDYWGKDSCSTDCLQFLLQELHNAEMPHILSASRKLLNMYVPVEVKFSKKDGLFSVTNKKGITKRQKAKMKAELEAFPEITSILKHPAIHVEVEFQWNDNAKASTKAYLKRRIKNGVDAKELLSLLTQAAKEVVEESEKDQTKAA